MKFEENKKELPKLTPDYIGKNKLWDSSWLSEKYPQKFRNDKK